jgi:hypothetical protein
MGTRHDSRWRRLCGWIRLSALTLGVLLLAGCGATSSAPPAGQSSAERTAQALALATPASTATNDPISITPATPDPTTFEQVGCPTAGAEDTPRQYVTVDGLKVSNPQRLAGYPSEVMPNNEPSAPYKVPLTAGEAQDPRTFQPNPAVNPSLGNGYEIQVCNPTSSSQTISGLRVTIASFTPSSGPVTVWHVCQDGPYDAATKYTTPGCGGGFGGVDWLAATLPSDSTGASAPATAQGSGGANPPFAIGPNTSIAFLIAVNGLTSQGTYTLSIGISINGAAPTQVSSNDGTFLMAPAAIVWTGTACQTPAMQALIPPATQDTYYVCPPTS